jgi:hypothetical protein
MSANAAAATTVKKIDGRRRSSVSASAIAIQTRP